MNSPLLSCHLSWIQNVNNQNVTSKHNIDNVLDHNVDFILGRHRTRLEQAETCEELFVISLFFSFFWLNCERKREVLWLAISVFKMAMKKGHSKTTFLSISPSAGKWWKHLFILRLLSLLESAKELAQWAEFVPYFVSLLLSCALDTEVKEIKDRSNQ